MHEILDNVLIHSGKELGTVITHYDSANHVLSFLVADDGIGVRESLSENENIQTNKELNPAEVVANRTNVAAQYNETFLNDNELEELW